MNQRIDWSNGPVQCKEDGCSTMLRPSGCKPEGQWTGTRRCVGRGRCLKHWREVAVREKADAMQAQRRAAGRPTKKGLVVRRSAGEAVVTWPVPPEGEELWLEKKLLTLWARQALDSLGFRMTDKPRHVVHHGLGAWIETVIPVRPEGAVAA